MSFEKLGVEWRALLLALIQDFLWSDEDYLAIVASVDSVSTLNRDMLLELSAKNGVVVR